MSRLIHPGSEYSWAAIQFRDQVAVVFGEREFTYAEIDTRANRLAHTLHRLGLNTGDRVAVLLNNSVESLETMIGIAKAGLTFVALNARHAAAEHSLILQDCAASAVIAGPEFELVVKEALKGAATVRHVLTIGWDGSEHQSYDKLLDAAPSSAPELEISDDVLVRIAYTSGTTGRPKGIAYSFARWRERTINFFMALEYRLGPQDSMIHVGPLTHAAGNYLIPYYLRGARNVILAKFEPDTLLRLVEREKITHLFLVPTMLIRLLDHLDGGATYDLSSLSVINYGTAATPEAVIKRALTRFGPILRQHFGMSECPQPLTVLYPTDHLDSRKLTSCGRPSMNVRITIRGEDGARLPGGEVGEIAIEARGVADIQYWNMPGLRDEVVRNGQLYTGDLGRLDEDGFLYIVGRNKDMIISGGFNVYAREVEDVLFQMNGIADAAVCGLPDDTWGEIVVAAVVPQPRCDLSEASVLEDIRPLIAGYKKPRRIAVIPELPRNLAGKVDKPKLARSMAELFQREPENTQ